MKIFAINLDKDVKRRLSLQAQCDRLGLVVEWVRGIYGKQLSRGELQRDYRPHKARRLLGREMTYAEIGCALSHLSIYRRIEAERIPLALILEDDVIFDARLAELLDRLQGRLDAAVPSVVLLSPAIAKSDGGLELADGFSIHAYLAGFYTHAYVVNCLGARALMRALYPVGNVADCWRRLVRHRVVDIQVVLPEVVVQDQAAFGSSTTEDDRFKLDGRNVPRWLLYKGRRACWLALDSGVACYRRCFNPYLGVMKEQS